LRRDHGARSPRLHFRTEEAGVPAFFLLRRQRLVRRAGKKAQALIGGGRPFAATG